MEHQHCISSTRPEASRAHSWPTPTAPRSKTDPTGKHLDIVDLDEHPEEHFLSPVQMYDYDDWSSDSDDDDANEVEWSAGITDFALFDQDRQQAKASGQAIPAKWVTMLSSQASALGRAVERSRHEDLPHVPPTENMPDLTPDASPQLYDDLDIGADQSQTGPGPLVPSYLRPMVSYSKSTKAVLPFYAQPRRTQSSPLVPSTKLVRPGLRDGRTLSGKEHVWQRPAWDMFTVREDSAAELNAEKGSTSSQLSQTSSSRFHNDFLVS